MNRSILLVTLTVCAVAGRAEAQVAATRAGVADTSPFRPLALPAPNQIRTGSGMPGAAYWQQKADYDIKASLDTSTHTVRGEETIRYTNNSPDTLRYVWL
jgi:hypothetical protein